ncbi:MAG: phosphatidate cytidylyltransferase [Acidobacteriota bacterium]
MQRLLTAAVLAPPFVASMFWGPWQVFMAIIVLGISLAAWEFGRIARPAGGRGVLALLPILIPLAAAALAVGPQHPRVVFSLAVGLVLVPACLVLFERSDLSKALAGVGALTFGTLYFAVPMLVCFRLRQFDSWVVFLGFAIVFLGDTGAYYFGRAFGRRKLAPRVSPNKSWEGAFGGLAVALLVTALWSLGRFEEIRWPLIGLAAVTSIAAQLGDLVESMFKRGSGIKDSGTLLPGHGGAYDRIDGLLFGLPVLWLGAQWLGIEALLP